MCYDVNVAVKIEAISAYFGGVQVPAQLTLDMDTGVHVQAQSYKKCPVITMDDGVLNLREFEWGVIADYMKTPEDIKKYRSLMCNAQSEKILGDKRSFWYRIRTRRCLLPVYGFYEHREVKGWKNKIPYYITLKDREMFALPGIYAYAPVPDIETGEARGCFTIVTRAANSIMRHIHNGGSNPGRMPLLLPKDKEIKWLTSVGDDGTKDLIEYELPSHELFAYPVHTIRTTKARPDGGKKSDPYEWIGLPEPGHDLDEQQKLF